ncbi:MAG: glycosyltransferase family 4 protein [Verrucomicrobiota bacterium]
MKLALIRRQFSATGGAELYLQRLLGALANRGHEVHLFAENWVGHASGVHLHPVLANSSRAVRSLRFAEAVQRDIAKDTFDCVFSLERTFQQDVYRAGDGLQRVWGERRKQFSPWWKKSFIGRGTYHRSRTQAEIQTFDPYNTRRIIVNSEMVRREILEHFAFPLERIHLVRNGVDVSRFRNGQRTDTRRRFGVKNGEFLLLFVGSGWERKGLRFAIAAFRRLKGDHAGLKLLVVGKGRKPIFVPRGVIFAGPMSDVENAYAAADLLVFPPIYEASANVVIEALAAGLPVVTSAYNGAAEVIQENVTGSVVCEFWRPEILAQAIKPWIEIPRRIQADYDDFSLERNVSETLAILELAAKERRQ